MGIHRPRAPSSVAVPAPIAARSASRAATPSRMSLPARRCSPSGLGARRSAPSLHPPCRPATEPPWSSSPPKDACSSSPPGPVPVGKHPPGVKNVRAVEPLGRSGQAIPGHFTSSPDGPPPLTWMAPHALSRWWPLWGFTVPYQGPGYHAPARPRPGVCELAQHGLPALHAQFGHTIAWIAPVPDALGEVFLSCVDTEYCMDGWPSRQACCSMATGRGRFWGQSPARRRYPTIRTWSTYPSVDSR